MIAMGQLRKLHVAGSRCASIARWQLLSPLYNRLDFTGTARIGVAGGAEITRWSSEVTLPA
ncbi:hypothetical protein AXW83_13080 [Bosea sp. PAMC 26642]|nr:hypothetical protein AXW83_13080 [Bosea sp. PAMC 26642]